MATYNTLKRGSTGADVKKLQQSLMDKGYDLGKTGADGKYGAITEAAVKKYQKDNKLTIDGLAGNETQGSIFAVPKTDDQTAPPTATAPTQSTPSAAPPKTQTTPAADTPADDPAIYSAYQSALSELMKVQGTMPTLKDSFSTQIQDVYNKIVNREKFSYDVNSDALYQQMNDQYIAQGKLAMADTMGQAAAMNGGYGSSYGQSVGQQAYQGYMQQLNDAVPELYDRALALYNQEGQDMLNQYAMLRDMADDEYAKHLDDLNTYYKNLDIAISEVDKAYNRGYQASRDAVGDKQWDKTFNYNAEQDKIVNDRIDADTDRTNQNDAYNKVMTFIGTGYNPTDAELKAAGMTREQLDAYVSQYNKEEEKANQPNEYNKVMQFIGTDYTPSDSELAAAGLTRAQYDAISKYATTSATGGTSLDNVASMSSTEIVEALQGFQLIEDNTGLESFLDDCVATGRMTEAQADEYYRKYMTKVADPMLDYKQYVGIHR
jgi:peptidoglycan hydrolase-like protein with peptidoglycan-binding domain